MSKKYLCSDMSEQEARFFTCGRGVFGEENAITGLYKLIGKFNELKELNKEEELSAYAPDKDFRFKYENLGITILSAQLKAKYGKKKISRKSLKTLSRKWCLIPVLISFNCPDIFQELATYVNSNNHLKKACNTYLSRIGCQCENLMPIQFDFLSTRFFDQHRNFQKAGEMINKLSQVCFA